MKVIFDCRQLRMYPVGKPGFTGGTESMVHVLAKGLAEAGHTVHVVCPDLDDDEQRGERLTYWGPRAFPTRADAVVMVHSLVGAEDYTGDALVLASNGTDPDLGPDGRMAELVSAYPVFSRTHGELLCRGNPTVPRERVVVTGLGVDPNDYTRAPGGFPARVPGRMWVGNDPARGLWHVLDVFERVRESVPDASLHISYDFDRQFEQHKWRQNALAEMLWDCRRRMATLPGVVNLVALDHAAVVREQMECRVHCWPSDPPNVGSQIHGLSQLEAAAAGCALVLSDVEAFPEVFGEAAVILPTIGTFDPAAGRRVDADDYADAVSRLMQDGDAWLAASKASRALAEQHPWANVIEKWDTMLAMLNVAVKVAEITSVLEEASA